MSNASNAALAVRILPDNPNHHLWNNNGTWWCHYTLHLRDFTKWRVRHSLRTTCLTEARTRRDRLLRELCAGNGVPCPQHGQLRGAA